MTNTTAGAIPTNGHAKNGQALDGRGAGAPLPAVSDGAGKMAIEKAATPAAGAQGRVQGGRFGPGNKFGRGNPFTRKYGTLRAAFLDAVTADDVMDLARTLWAKAVAGDLAAAALFLLYALGKPTEAVNPDDADLDEFDRLRRWPVDMHVIGCSERKDPAIAAEAVRTWAVQSVERLVADLRRINAAEQARHEAAKVQADKAPPSSAADLAAVMAAAEKLMQAGQAAGNGKKG